MVFRYFRRRYLCPVIRHVIALNMRRKKHVAGSVKRLCNEACSSPPRHLCGSSACAKCIRRDCMLEAEDVEKLWSSKQPVALIIKYCKKFYSFVWSAFVKGLNGTDFEAGPRAQWIAVNISAFVVNYRRGILLFLPAVLCTRGLNGPWWRPRMESCDMRFTVTFRILPYSLSLDVCSKNSIWNKHFLLRMLSIFLCF